MILEILGLSLANMKNTLGDAPSRTWTLLIPLAWLGSRSRAISLVPRSTSRRSTAAVAVLRSTTVE